MVVIVLHSSRPHHTTGHPTCCSTHLCPNPSSCPTHNTTNHGCTTTTTGQEHVVEDKNLRQVRQEHIHVSTSPRTHQHPTCRWRQGACLEGDLCNFAHGDHELRVLPPDMLGKADASKQSKQPSKTDSKQSTQPKPETSTQQHVPSHIDTTLLKTKLCSKFMSTGYCPYGVKCVFAHGQEELRQRPSKGGGGGGSGGGGGGAAVSRKAGSPMAASPVPGVPPAAAVSNIPPPAPPAGIPPPRPPPPLGAQGTTLSTRNTYPCSHITMCTPPPPSIHPSSTTPCPSSHQPCYGNIH